MNDILFLIFNVTLYIQYARSLYCWGMTRTAERYVFAFFLMMIQIMGSLLLLGAIGWLYPAPAIGLNAAILLAVKMFSPPISPPVDRDKSWQEIAAPISNKLIIFAAAVVTCWLFICAYFLPPRGGDDIVYHLPFIYDSIQHGRWVLLPTELRIHFAYPMNAEVLFSWPLIFLGDTRWVDGVNIPVGLWTAGVMYLFSRHFGLRRASAAFISGVFFLTPIVVAQMGTNYVDLISAGILLSSLYLVIRFLNNGSTIYSCLAFFSIAAMMGMKYHLLFFGLILLVILVSRLSRKRRLAETIVGLIIVAILGLGWHVRNYIQFSDWLYPVRASAGYWDLQSQSVGDMIRSVLEKINFVFLSGKNCGTYDGGFGTIFAFIAFL
ncbi:MAG: hypothetical protein HQL19_08735, partial [Candidatus Omnitrophica bacterium]|nr:hypothetical protein [Candidatus Omnitrophota bacterium]